MKHPMANVRILDSCGLSLPASPGFFCRMQHCRQKPHGTMQSGTVLQGLPADTKEKKERKESLSDLVLQEATALGFPHVTTSFTSGMTISYRGRETC